jgi:hypothetical protein
MAQAESSKYTGLSRIVKHVSGHLSLQYVLILLGDTDPSAEVGGFQPAGMADIGQHREPWLFSVPPRASRGFAFR